MKGRRRGDSARSPPGRPRARRLPLSRTEGSYGAGRIFLVASHPHGTGARNVSKPVSGTELSVTTELLTRPTPASAAQRERDGTDPPCVSEGLVRRSGPR